MKPLGFLSALCLWAAVAFGQNITRVEYYIDTDPGFGSGTSLLFSGTNSVVVNQTISLSSVSAGRHTLYVRAKDANGKWSNIYSRPFYVAPMPSDPEPNIVQAEFFVGDDPGEGNGTAISISTPADSVTVSQNFSLAGVEEGRYTLSLRAKDARGVWSNIFSRPVYVSHEMGTAEPNITQVEYYFDSDPGIGSGTSISLTQADSVTLSEDISLSALSDGRHQLYVRAKDASGNWSLPYGRTVYKTRVPTDVKPNIVAAEYFIDSDPGEGSGTAVSITPGTEPTANFEINIDALSSGRHQLYVRSKDANGHWSSLYSRPFMKTILASDPKPNIVYAEYFIGDDPGRNNATELGLTPADSVRFDQNFALSPTDLGPTNFVIRARDARGSWSEPWVHSFEVLSPLDSVFARFPLPEQSGVPLRTTLVWTSIPEAVRYEVQVDKNPGFNTENLQELAPTDTTVRLNGLQYDGVYYWRVRPVADGAMGAWSEINQFATASSTPATAMLISPSHEAVGVSTDMVLTWRLAQRATTYEVEVAKDPEFVEIVSFSADKQPLDAAELNTYGLLGSYQVSGLDNDSTYYWRVKSMNDFEDGEWSDTWQFTTAKPGLEPIALSEPLDGQQEILTPLNLMWNSVEYAQAYRLELSEDPGFGERLAWTGLQDTTYRVPRLRDTTVFYWRVAALNEERAASVSQTFTFRTGMQGLESAMLLEPVPDDQAVSIPAQFVWSEVSSANAYRLEISTDREFNAFRTWNNIPDTSVSVAALMDTTKYYWRVISMSSRLDPSFSEIDSFKTVLRVPEIPDWSPVNGAENVKTTVKLVWASASRAEAYDLQLSLKEGFDEISDEVSGVADTTATIEGLKEGSTYFWRVRATNAAGASDWSAARNFTTEVGTSTEIEEIPTAFQLNQNYPNPFNPSTAIQFGLPEASRVQIAVYDVTGKRFGLLTDQNYAAGYHTVNFDASQLASGIYIYQMRAGERVFTKKMMLIK